MRCAEIAVVLLIMSGLWSARAVEPRVLLVFEAGARPLATGLAGITARPAPEAPDGRTCLKVSVAGQADWRRDGPTGTPLDAVRVASLASPYLPPEADAVRLHVRLLSGRAIVTVGGPVSQIGPSDVFCDPQVVDAKDGTGWRTLELSLNRRLVRNFRRAGFTANLPVVYYTRWAQEPLGLYLASLPASQRPAGETVLLVDQVELLACGDGRTFPTFDPAIVKPVATLADFEGTGSETQVVTVGHGSFILSAFEAGYRRPASMASAKLPAWIVNASPFIREEGVAYPAPRFSRIEGRNGGHALQAEGVWAEEGQIVTIRTPVPAGANALTFSIKPTFPATAKGPYAFQHDGRPAQAVDVVVFVAPAGTSFPWQAIGPSDELLQAARADTCHGPGARYAGLLVGDRQAPVLRVPEIRQAGAFGFYTARRHVPAGTWSSTVIPLDDFVCVYGQDACAVMQQRQQPLRPETIAGIGFLAPYGSGHGTLALDDLAAVRVPGASGSLRSFWQVPEIGAVRLTPLPRYRQYRTWMMMTLGEQVPAFLKDVE